MLRHPLSSHGAAFASWVDPLCLGENLLFAILTVQILKPFSYCASSATKAHWQRLMLRLVSAPRYQMGELCTHWVTKK